MLSKFILLIGIAGILSCGKSPEKEPSLPAGLKTKNVVVVIMDGARYSETWGDSTLENIPKMGIELASESVVLTNFYNNGETRTVPGHTAITSTYYQSIENNGSQIPDNPSFLQYWIKEKEADSTKAWVITSKDKLQVLANCENPDFKDKYMPANNCGVNGAGVGSGYRKDSLTFEAIKTVLNNYHPQLLLINFKEPDVSGHSGIWENYLAGIKSVDNYVYELWNILQADAVYKDKTTLIVTNDHGRHLDTIANGFKGHGDGCEGCRHIMFFAMGPDFKNGDTIDLAAEQVDIPKTIAKLLDFDFPEGEGRVLDELFRDTK
jgi:hypothetical protein